MSRRGVLVSIGLLLSIIVTVLVVVPGPAIAGVALPDIHSVGRLPDSPAYFITSCKRGITSLFTFGSHDKAILALKYANEDVLAIDTLCDKGKCEAAEEHCATFQEDFEKAAEHALKARY